MEEKETKDGLTRRGFLSNTALGAIGLAAAGFSAGALITPREANAANPVLGSADFPLPTAQLDAAKIRKYGYYSYQKYGGCGLGSARALIQGILDAHAAGGTDPKSWANVPLNLYAWCNGGGVGGWGTLCGAIAGSVGVLTLAGLHTDLGSGVFEWYTKQNFPLANFDDYLGEGLYPGETSSWAPIKDADVKGHAVTDSPLCHVSVSKWLAASHVKLGDKNDLGQGLKEDRCGKVTGDTAAYTATLINQFIASGAKPAAWAKPAAMAGCFDCHDYSNPTGISKKDAQTKMDCLPCHTDPVSGRK